MNHMMMKTAFSSHQCYFQMTHSPAFGLAQAVEDMQFE
jgi:hypothetical protein